MHVSANIYLIPKTAKAPLEWAQDEDAHFGFVNVLLGANCLDILRRSVYYNHYYRKLRGFGEEPPEDYRAIYYSHLDRYLHYLLEIVKRNADLAMTTYNWFENQTKPNPDFGTVRQCRDFESVAAWQAKITSTLALFGKKELLITKPSSLLNWTLSSLVYLVKSLPFGALIELVERVYGEKPSVAMRRLASNSNAELLEQAATGATSGSVFCGYRRKTFSWSSHLIHEERRFLSVSGGDSIEAIFVQFHVLEVRIPS